MHRNTPEINLYPRVVNLRPLIREPNQYNECWVLECIEVINPATSTRNICSKCYQLVKFRGGLDDFPRVTIFERFWSQVIYGPKDECWVWRGSKDIEGYGRFSYDYKQYKAHRYSLEVCRAVALDKDIHACHTCDNASCVNYNHLFAGTAKENHDDMVSKGRAPWQGR